MINVFKLLVLVNVAPVFNVSGFRDSTVVCVCTRPAWVKRFLKSSIGDQFTISNWPFAIIANNDSRDLHLLFVIQSKSLIS